MKTVLQSNLSDQTAKGEEENVLQNSPVGHQMEDLLREEVNIESERQEEHDLQEDHQQHGEEPGDDEVVVVQPLLLLPLLGGCEEAEVREAVQLYAGDDHQDCWDGRGGEDHGEDASECSSAYMQI